MRKDIAIALTLLGALDFSSASASALAPSRASDVVNLVSGAANATCSPGGFLGSQITPDGTTVPFSIPAGHVLVVTEIRVENNSNILTPGHLANPSLFNANGGQELGVSAPGIVGPDGNFAAAAPVSNLIVRPGVILCSDAQPGSSWVTFVKGFIAKDN